MILLDLLLRIYSDFQEQTLLDKIITIFASIPISIAILLEVVFVDIWWCIISTFLEWFM